MSRDVVALVRNAGGIVRSADLVRRGVPKRAIADAVAGGALIRTRRFWVATPDVDPMLFAAARSGVVLTCVTEAERQGLWVLERRITHVGAPSHAGCIEELDAVIHWDAPLIARHPAQLVDPIENVLAIVARCQPFEAALAIWESALRKGLADRAELERFDLSARARELLATASPFSDSGLETFVPPRLRWLRVRIIPQAWLLDRPVDFLIGDRLVLQIDGGHHVGAQREADIAHDARLMLQGYHVIRVGYRQVVSDWPTVQDLIARAVAQGLHTAR
jgi:very-short-patch-repair endonuclease